MVSNFPTGPDHLPRRAWTVAEAIQIIAISRSHLYKEIATGRLPSIRIGRSRRILDHDLQAYLESLRDQREQEDGAAWSGQPPRGSGAAS